MTTNLSGRDLKDEVTPYSLYANRRRFVRGLGAVGTLAASAATYRWFNPVRKMELDTANIDVPKTAELTREQLLERGFLVDEAMTSESHIISYNNFYEFSTDKNAVAEVAKGFDTTGWQISVEGMVHKPRIFKIPDLKSVGPIEERIYRMRCVEAWSMVIPWVGLGPGRWKLLHRLAYLATILGVVHYYMLVKSDVRQPLAFAAVLTPILGFRSLKHYWDLRREATKSKSRETVKPNIGRKFWNGELTVSNIHRETHDVKTFQFVNPQGEIPFIHRPGQYMTLTLIIEGQSVKRSYTIASAPSQRAHVELSIKRNSAGLVSRFMHDQLKVGDSIRIGAPAGKFFFEDHQSHAVVLIGGGAGITPLMSILRDLTDRSWRGSIYLINAVRSHDDVIYRAELAGLVSRFENLQVLTYYSQSDPPEFDPDPSNR